jgi:ABC-type uncharacterized transport system substrate-binding protein
MATILLAALLSAPGPIVAADQVEVVLSGSAEIYKGLAESLRASVSASAPPIALHVRQEPATLEDAELRVGVGMNACRSLATAARSPVLCSLVPRAGFRGLPRTPAGRQVSAIYLDQPVSRQLALARALSPEAERVGLLVGPDLRREAAEIRRSARALGFRADLEDVGNEREATLGIQRLVSSNDLILAAYDSQVLTPTTAKWLLHLGYQRRLPVLGFSRTYLDAGALAAVYSTPQQIGRHTAEAILDFLGNGKGRLGTSAFPRYFEVAVNRGVARALGLDLPADAELTRKVERLDQEGP